MSRILIDLGIGISERFSRSSCNNSTHVYTYIRFSIKSERIQGGGEILASVRALLTYIGLTDKDVGATISEEIGGGNGIQQMIVAAEMNLPVVDMDLMGRAYPNVSIFSIVLRTHSNVKIVTDVPIVSTFIGTFLVS